MYVREIKKPIKGYIIGIPSYFVCSFFVISFNLYFIDQLKKKIDISQGNDDDDDDDDNDDVYSIVKYTNYDNYPYIAVII